MALQMILHLLMALCVSSPYSKACALRAPWAFPFPRTVYKQDHRTEVPSQVT